MNYEEKIEEFEFQLNNLMTTLDNVIIIFDNEGDFRKNDMIDDITLELDE